jgi:predicted nucleotidyltransferase
MAEIEVIELVKKYLDVLRTEGISVRKAFLYGSYSVGSASDESDIDVMIISDQFEKNNDKIAGKVWRLTSEVDSKIEPFLVGTDSFQENSSPIIQKVKATGIEIN